MINRPQATAGKNPVAKCFTSVLLTGATLLFLLQPGFSKNSEKVKLAIKETLEHYDIKDYKTQEYNPNDNETYNFDQTQNTINESTNALTFAVNNVSKYYPDMKDHLKGMIDAFGKNTEWKTAVNNIFNQTIMTISDPKQRIGGLIYALEGYVFRKSEFGDKHDSDITNETFLIMENAKDKYNLRVKQRQVDIAKIRQEIKDIQAEIERDKAEIERDKAEIEKDKAEIEKDKAEIEKGKIRIEKNNQELRNILNKITVQDIKKKQEIQQLVIQTKALFIKCGFKTNSPHIDELFKLVQ